MVKRLASHACNPILNGAQCNPVPVRVLIRWPWEGNLHLVPTVLYLTFTPQLLSWGITVVLEDFG
jgi:hypothetical protein